MVTLGTPWLLMSAGIVLLLIGAVAAGMSAPRSTMIDPRMSDEDIARQLQPGRGIPIPTLLIYLGGLLILISLVWRIARIVL